MSTTDDQIPPHVRFHYIKSNYFRVLHADGAFGGFTPQGNIFFSLYSERAALPDVTVQAMEAHNLGKELLEHRQGSQGVTRELEVGVTMNLPVAKSLLEWLKERIEIAEKVQSDLSIHESAGKK